MPAKPAFALFEELISGILANEPSSLSVAGEIELLHETLENITRQEKTQLREEMVTPAKKAPAKVDYQKANLPNLSLEWDLDVSPGSYVKHWGCRGVLVQPLREGFKRAVWKNVLSNSNLPPHLHNRIFCSKCGRKAGKITVRELLSNDRAFRRAVRVITGAREEVNGHDAYHFFSVPQEELDAPPEELPF